MTIRDLKYSINLVDETVAGFERIDSSFERNSAVSKMLSNNIALYGKIISEKEESIGTANFIVVSFKEITTATPAFNNQHSNQSAAITNHT